MKEMLTRAGHEVVDLGTDSDERVDYPEFAGAVAKAVAAGSAARGVLVCGSGIGMCMGANRVPGVRAAVIHDEFDAEMSRRHNDANVACFGARKMEADKLGALLELFLKSPFDGGRHEGRVAKLDQI